MPQISKRLFQRRRNACGSDRIPNVLPRLAYFVTLAREKQFARAADARGHRYLALTEEGQRVLAWAR